MLRSRIFIVALIVSLAGASGISIAKSNLITNQVVAQTATLRKGQGWLKELGLTREQMQQIKQIRQRSKDKITQNKQAITNTKQELETLMAGQASSEQVRTKYNQLKAMRQELADIQFENTLAIREVLNFQQRQKFSEHMYKNSKAK